MEIKSDDMTYFIPKDVIEINGSNITTDYTKLVPLDIKNLQDQVKELLREELPSNEELLEFARLEHPIAKQHEEALRLQTHIKNLTSQYINQMAAKGITITELPDYGGIIE